MQEAAGAADVMPAKAELHVTLWHSNDAAGACTPLDTLLPLEGSTFGAAITGFYCAPEISAAAIELQGKGAAIRRPVPPHITMRCDKGVNPATAGQLPARLEKRDKAVRWLPLAAADSNLVVTGEVMRHAGGEGNTARRKR